MSSELSEELNEKLTQAMIEKIKRDNQLDYFARLRNLTILLTQMRVIR